MTLDCHRLIFPSSISTDCSGPGKMKFEIKLQETKLELQEEYQLTTGYQSTSAAHETLIGQA